MSPVFTLNARELCNVVYATLTADLDTPQRGEFDATLNNPRGAYITAELRHLGVA